MEGGNEQKALPMTTHNNRQGGDDVPEGDEELELQLYANGAISTSSSWSTVPGASPLTLGEDVAEEKAASESNGSDSSDSDDINASSSAAAATAREELHLEQDEGCSSAIMAPESCPVFGGLFCGSYDLEEAEGVRRLSVTAAAAGRDLKRNAEIDVSSEKVSALPLFFSTRFRTLDAERWAQPTPSDRSPAGYGAASDMDSSCQSTTDWYDNMFSWLTLGSMSSEEKRSSSPTSWNGHLSLGPDLPSNAWKARRIRRKRRQSTGQMLAPLCIQRQGSRSYHQQQQQDVSPNSFHSILSSSQSPTATFDPTNPNATMPAPQLIRPLPIVPVNRPGQEDWEMIFLSNNDSGSASDEKSKASRRPPSATTSMSIPAGVSPSGKKESHSSKHKGSKGGTMDLDTIAVRTPGADRSALKELPALRDAPPTKREELFILKLKLCSVIFSFDDPTADKRGKDMKRQTLLELVDYVNTPAGQKIFTESVMADLMAMVSANVCRALPPATDDFDPEEDEPVLEPAWPHLQVAYEFFLRFIVSSEVNAKAAKKYVDQKFCLQLVELFDSEDPRERDYLKTILHRIYGKFMSHRSFIRRAISNVFYRFVYETERHNGIGELLEILGSIINGFAIPLKKEHLQFLVRALIPLHKPKCVALYHQQLSYCIIQYVEKDADTATPILNGFFKCWPWSSSAKQVMFLNELEEILELLGADQLAQVSTMLFTNLARCLDSDHFQVVERALFLWNNEHLVNSGCLSRLNAQTVLPIIYRPLYKNSAGHWNATVEGLAQNVLKMYMEYDLVLYDKCAKAYYREEEEAKRKLEALEAQWTAVEASAAQNMPALMAK